MGYCRKCGRQVGETDRVCGYCGTVQQPQQSQPASQPGPQQPPAPVQYAQKKQAKHMPVWLVVLIAVGSVLLVAAIAAVAVKMAGRSAKPQVNSHDIPTWTDEVEEALPEDNTAAPTYDMPYYVTGVAETIRVRQTADNSGVVLAKLETGDEVYIVDASGQTYWEIYVQDEDVTGYIDRHYLTEDWNAVALPEVYYVADAGQGVTLLDEPFATGSTKLGDLDQAAEVTVLAKPAGSYWYVYSDDLRAYGYLPAANLSEEVPQERVIGAGKAPEGRTMLYYVDSNDGFLVLRSEPTTSSSELGRIKTGEEVWVVDTDDGRFWYAYAPTLGKYGYVHSDYLSTRRSDAGDSDRESWTVRVATGYLALRTAKAYDYSNEIGKLYTGDVVEVIEKEGTYWWVYAPSLDKYGYVNSEYLHQ